MEKSITTNIENGISRILVSLYLMNPTEAKCFILILRNTEMKKETSRKELARLLNKDETTVTRALRKLESLGLIFKEKRCCTEGKKGRYFVYFSIDLNDLKQRLKRDAKLKYSTILKYVDML